MVVSKLVWSTTLIPWGQEIIQGLTLAQIWKFQILKDHQQGMELACSLPINMINSSSKDKSKPADKLFYHITTSLSIWELLTFRLNIKIRNLINNQCRSSCNSRCLITTQLVKIIQNLSRKRAYPNKVMECTKWTLWLWGLKSTKGKFRLLTFKITINKVIINLPKNKSNSRTF